MAAQGKKPSIYPKTILSNEVGSLFSLAQDSSELRSQKHAAFFQSGAKASREASSLSKSTSLAALMISYSPLLLSL